MELVLDFIFICGIVITILVLFLLIKPKKKELPQKLLIVFFIFLLFVIVFEYADLNDITILAVLSFTLEDTVVWFVGPLLLIYIKSLFLKQDNLLKNNFYHFIPFIIYLLFFSIPILISILSEEFFLSYLKPLVNQQSILIDIENTFLIVYLLLSLRLFSKYREIMKSNYSNFTDENFGWVKKMLIGTLIVISIDLSTKVYEQIYGELDWDTGYVTIIALIIFIIYLAYYGVAQSKILLPDFLINDEISNDDKKEKINYLSNISDQDLEELKSRLKKVLLEEKPYLDEDLTLNKLARLIPTTNKKLSTLLNQHLDTTFYDLINNYRVDSVKEKLHSGNYNNITLLGIAYESGFNSKTSFNRIFKKETGLSPSEYKNSSYSV